MGAGSGLAPGARGSRANGGLDRAGAGARAVGNGGAGN